MKLKVMGAEESCSIAACLLLFFLLLCSIRSTGAFEALQACFNHEGNAVEKVLQKTCSCRRRSSTTFDVLYYRLPTCVLSSRSCYYLKRGHNTFILFLI